MKNKGIGLPGLEKARQLHNARTREYNIEHGKDISVGFMSKYSTGSLIYDASSP